MVKFLKDFLERGCIEPCSSERTCSCFVVPTKVAGDWRLVVEYRDWNWESQHNAYSLPLINNLLKKQQGKRIFSVLDLKYGNHHMSLAKSSQVATGMSTLPGLKCWKVIPMGTQNRNAQFQRVMEDLLKDLHCADLFVDNIIVHSGTPEMTSDELIEAHFVDPYLVLHVLGKHQLTCNGAKAVLSAKEVEFAGQVVGPSTEPGNPRQREHPEKITEMSAFMGFCSYYFPYVHIYPEHAAPLTKLLQVGPENGNKGSKKVLAWTPESEKAFDHMKAALLKCVSL